MELKADTEIWGFQDIYINKITALQNAMPCSVIG
jgi:hypothetical protein